MTDSWITFDDALIVIHRLITDLFRSVVAGNQFREQLRKDLQNPKPMDWVMLCDRRNNNLPAALQSGSLLPTQKP